MWSCRSDANGNAAPATSADVIDAIGFTPIDSADADLLITTAIDDLKDGVPTPGDTLQKLYNLILGSFTEVIVPNIAARDAYNVLHTPTVRFVVACGNVNFARVASSRKRSQIGFFNYIINERR